MRQVQAHEVQGHRLRKMRRGSDRAEGPPRPHGPYRTRFAGSTYLVPEIAAIAHRPDARHDAQGPRARSVLRELRRSRTRIDPAEAAPVAYRRRVYQGTGRVW